MKKIVSRLTALLLCLLLCASPALAIRLPSVSTGPAAELNGEGYETLSAAIAAASPGDELKLLENSSESCEVSKPLIILRSAGKTASQLSAGPGFVLEETDTHYRIYQEDFAAQYCLKDSGCLIAMTYHLGQLENQENGIVIAACYDSAGRMIGAASKSLTPAANGTLQLTVKTSGTVSSVKAYVLDSSYVPIFMTKELEKDASIVEGDESLEVA